MKKIYRKLTSIALLATLGFSGCTSINGVEYNDNIIKYDTVIENTKTEKNYEKILSEIKSKSKISEQDLYLVAKSDYYVNDFDKNNVSKQEKNTEIVNFYSKKYNMTNNTISDENMKNIIKYSVKEIFEKEIVYKKMDDYVLNKSVGLTTLNLISNDTDLKILEKTYKNQMLKEYKDVYFNIFDTIQIVNQINQYKNSGEFFTTQNKNMEIYIKSEKNINKKEELIILKNIIETYEQVFNNMMIKNNLDMKNYTIMETSSEKRKIKYSNSASIGFNN